MPNGKILCIRWKSSLHVHCFADFLCSAVFLSICIFGNPAPPPQLSGGSAMDRGRLAVLEYFEGTHARFAILRGPTLLDELDVGQGGRVHSIVRVSNVPSCSCLQWHCSLNVSVFKKIAQRSEE